MLQDDGEFDDLYGNPPPSASSSAVRQKPRNYEATEAQPVTPDGRPSLWSPMASSSVVSRSYVHDKSGFSTSNTTDATDSGKQEKRSKRDKKPRHKTSQELFDVQWESDVKAVKCGLCKSDFSLVRRKHHCRYCGRIMCSDCSSFLYFDLSRRKHRVCSACNNQLLAEQDAYARETMTAGDSTLNVVADSSNGERLASLARTSTSNDDDEKARKKQEENLRKEKKRREQLQKKGVAAKGPTTATAFWNQSVGIGNKLTTADGKIIDDADGDWFTDVPDQQTSSRNSVEAYSEKGWRDRVKDTYTVTPTGKQTPVPAQTAHSLLSSGITGKSYMSDQLRYDVSRPERGHDDDISAEMPRPQQQIVTLAYTDRGEQPSGLPGDGYFSEQFQYDDVGGPGLGHDDNHSTTMPRPKQQSMTTPYSYKSARRSPKLLELNSADESTSYEQGFQARFTFTDIFSATKRRESTAKRREKKAEASNPRALSNQNMTLDELNSSSSSRDGSYTLAPTVSTLNPDQPTFYDQDADELVVDESPGYFEATMEEREAQHKKEERQYEHLARNTAWANNSLLPTTVHRFSSKQDSYSIVNPPSHTSSSPIGHQSGDVKNDTGGSGKTKSGFTGALKRFFGMGSKKASTPPKKLAKTPRAAGVAPPKKDIAENYASPVLGANHHDSTITTESVSGGLLRRTVANYNGDYQEKPVSQANFRNTMTALVDSNSRVEVTLPSNVGESKQHHQKQEPEHKRRGTFDELFMSPKANIDDFSGRFSTDGRNNWAAQENTNVGQASFGAVGVARFDQRRPADISEEFVPGNGYLSFISSSQPADYSTEAWRESAAMSWLNDKKVASEAEESGFTWSNIGSSSGLGTATYAVPTILQPRAVYSDTIGTSTRYETPATLGGIMDDLKYGSVLNKPQGTESIDDFFAESEQTNNYIFDSTTGSYVAARVPARGVAPRSVKRSKSTELLVLEKIAPTTSNHGYNDPSLIAGTAIATNDNGEEVEDDVAEIIVDKISSLESELAALKQLIRTRKGGGGSQSRKPRVSRSTVDSIGRKDSIFDNGSSDEENGASYTSSIRSVVERGSKRRSGSKKKFAKTRKDSFANLFEDSPNEHKVFGGATSYEALFQTEEKLTDISKDDVSDDDVDPIQPPKSKTAKSRHSSRKFDEDVLSNDSDSEPELTSLKKRRGKLSSRRKTREYLNDTSSNMDEGKLVTSPSRLGAKLGSTNIQIEEDDPIDALFDNSNDQDVINLYGKDENHDGEDEYSVLEPNLAPISMSKSVLRSQKSLSDAEASSEGSHFTVNDVPADHALPTAFLADTSSSGMSVGALEDETPNFSLTDGDFKPQPVLERKHMTEPATEDVVTNEKKQHDEADVPASVNPAPVDDAIPSPKVNKVALTEEASGTVRHLSLPNLGLIEEPSDMTEKVVRQDDAASDILYKSGDVEFLSLSSSLGLKTPDQEKVGSDSENGNKETLSGNDESFTFEIQAPMKRCSGDVPTTISSVQSVSEYSKSSRPSVISSANGGPSSRNPSIDSILDDPEDTTVDGNSVLGKVELQAFDTDWQQMQAEEKERKKRLQVKQRQAQRGKLLRKQGASTRSLSGSNATHGSSKSKSKSGKKKKKAKEKDDATSSSSHHTKSGSSRKHRRDATDSRSEPPRLLTEL
ncbi:hypothetical protein KXD40_004259 [Peronospora effusa]|nr:hypothetical protein KXD40_004259 [Peronospora effusa]